VVLRSALYVEPEKAADSTLFRGFQLNQAGRALLPRRVHARGDGPRWTLRDKVGAVNEEGIAGDSIGRRAGFAWAPTKAQLGERTIKFRVRQPREVSNEILGRRLQVGLAEGANLIVMRLSGTAQQKPGRDAQRLGRGVRQDRHRAQGGAVTASTEVLAQQRAEAEKRSPTPSARTSSSACRPSTCRPTRWPSAPAPGCARCATTRRSTTTRRASTARGAARDRVQLERTCAAAPDYVPVEAMLNVPLVNTDPAAPRCASLNELVQLQAQVRDLRRTCRTSPRR
jgi:hypothetical protein